MSYRPAVPFTTAFKLLIPTTTMVKGIKKKTFPDPETAPQIFGTFRTFGGTETTENDLFTVVSTGYVDTWYRPDIKSDCRLYLCETCETYDILGDPENIEMRNQYMKIRVQKIGGNDA